MNLKLVIITCFFLSIFCACNQNKESCHKNIPIEANNTSLDESIYNITSDWKKQDGTTVKLDIVKGKIVVAAMVFTHCQSACPRIVADIQRIQKEVGNNPNVQYLLISMDPERDTPERFKEFMAERQIDPNWLLISSSQTATDEMANVLGVKVKKLSDGGFDHSNAIFVINPNGIIIHTQEGLEQEPKETIQKIKELEQSNS